MSNFRRGFFVLSLGTLFGKVIALLREVVFAGAFGTSEVAAGFRVAQTASMVPANLISGDVLSAAFAPAYARESRREPAIARAMLWGYSIWFTMILFLVAFVVFWARESIVDVIVPGAGADVIKTARDILSVLCWCIPLFGLSALQAYALGVHGIYFMTSIRPMIQSLGLLGGTIAAISTGWVMWLAVFFVVAWVLYVLACSLILLSRGLLGVPRIVSVLYGWRFVIAGFRAIGPLLLLPVALQGSIVLERVFASFGQAGLVAGVDYARTISESVMSLVAVPLGILGLTQLAGVSPEDYRRKVAKMADFVVVFMLPVSMIIVVSAEPIVRIVYDRGAFDSKDVSIVSSVLIGLSAGLMFQILGYSLSRALTASGRNKSVLLYTLIAIVGQVAVQGIGVWHFGPLAIGLGPSIFGLLLSIGCAFALGELGRITLHLLALSPGVLITIVVLFTGIPPMTAAGFLAVVWAANILLVPGTRRILWQQMAPLYSRVMTSGVRGK